MMAVGDLQPPRLPVRSQAEPSCHSLPLESAPRQIDCTVETNRLSPTSVHVCATLLAEPRRSQLATTCIGPRFLQPTKASTRSTAEATHRMRVHTLDPP